MMKMSGGADLASLAAAFHWDHLAERLEQLYGLAMAQR
jgi:hypothetical protein